MSWGTWCEEFGRRFALQNWKEMVRSHPGRAWRRTTTGSPQADQKLDSVKLELLRWLGLCHCSARTPPLATEVASQGQSTLKGCHVTWGHGRTFTRLSRSGHFAHLQRSPFPFIMLLTTPPANLSAQLARQQFQPQTSLKRSDSRLQLRMWDRTSPTSEQDHPAFTTSFEADPAKISCNADCLHQPGTVMERVNEVHRIQRSERPGPSLESLRQNWGFQR